MTDYELKKMIFVAAIIQISVIVAFNSSGMLLAVYSSLISMTLTMYLWYIAFVKKPVDRSGTQSVSDKNALGNLSHSIVRSGPHKSTNRDVEDLFDYGGK